MKRPTLLLVMALGAAGPAGLWRYTHLHHGRGPDDRDGDLDDAPPVADLPLRRGTDLHAGAVRSRRAAHRRDPQDGLARGLAHFDRSTERPRGHARQRRRAAGRGAVRRRHGDLQPVLLPERALGIDSRSSRTWTPSISTDRTRETCVVSFDVPTELPAGSGIFYEPADLVCFKPTGGGGPGDWTFAGIVFDASAAGLGVSISDNLIGADGGPA